MPIYSHSRISTFENCPLKFKYKYVDKIETEIEQTIEAFMGSLVHDTLEKLYVDLKFEKQNTKEDLIKFFNDEWQKNYNENILIVRKDYSADNFRKMGEKYISTFFDTHKPFDDAITLDTEKRILIDLDGYKLQGYIDRLAVREDTYEIHDYKTSSSLPLQEYLEEDRQLALYSIAIKEGYKDAKRIKLIWHFLAFNKDISIEKTDQELEELKKQTIQTIKEIESCEEFPPQVSRLCDWCEFRPICPRWTHLAQTEQLPLNEFLGEKGVVLANKYVELYQKKKNIEGEMEKLKEAIFKYCEKNQMDTLFGSDFRLAVRTYENFKFPRKDDPLREHLEKTLKKIGLFDDVADIDVFKLSRMMKDGKLDKDTVEILKNFAKLDEVRRIYVNKKY